MFLFTIILFLIKMMFVQILLYLILHAVSLLNHRAHRFGAVTVFLKLLHDLRFMFRSERFDRNAQLHCRVPVDRYKLVMLKLNDITIQLRDHICHAAQFSRLIRQERRYRKNAIPQDQSLLHD